MSDHCATHVLRRLLALVSGQDVVKLCREKQGPAKV